MRAHPQELVDRACLLAKYHPLQVVAEILGLLPSQITAFKRRGWKTGVTGRPKRPVPIDFIFQSNRMSHAELVKHYRAGHATVSRWMAVTPNCRPSWRGEALRIDRRTGKRVWQMDRRGSRGAREDG